MQKPLETIVSRGIIAMRGVSLRRMIISLFNWAAIPRVAHQKKSVPRAVRYRQSQAPVLPRLESSILPFNHQNDILSDDTLKVNLTTILSHLKEKQKSRRFENQRLFWSEWSGSNARPPGPKPGALPTALHPDIWINYSKKVAKSQKLWVGKTVVKKCDFDHN